LGLRSWLRDFVGGSRPATPLPPRHQRREAARDRRAEGGPGWTDADRHENQDGTREVADVAPGTPGWGGSRQAGGR
jgi:hypothetical protein